MNIERDGYVNICRHYKSEVNGMRQGDSPIGRHIELHPGKDGLLQIVTIQSCHSYYKRPVVKVAKIVLNDGFGESIDNEEPIREPIK
jgi:hypothetical protein